MESESRARLIDVIARTYSREQFDALVRRFLGVPLEYYAIAGDMRALVSKLFDELERTPVALTTFLLKLAQAGREPALRDAINVYLGVPDPRDYDALLVFDEPFVNRQLFRNQLRGLFQEDRYRAMVTVGANAVGKSHSRWLLQKVARAEGIDTVYVELAETSVASVVSKLINLMSLPVTESRDRLAQSSTLAKGFVEVLQGHATKMAPGERWCLIFDSHDKEGVGQDLREFVDRLLAEVANLQMPAIWVVVLGYRLVAGSGGLAWHRVVVEDVQPLTAPDVDRFLREWARRAGKELSEEETTALMNEAFADLVPPLDHEGMATLAGRLRDQLERLGGGI